jgi:hypothetical protein
MIAGMRTEIESVSRLKRLWNHKPNLLKKNFFGLELEVEKISEKASKYPAGQHCSWKFMVNSSVNQDHNLIT